MSELNKLLEIKLLVNENIIKETLSRMGIVDKKDKKIYQSCHLLKQFNTYYLAHFKQLFTLSTSKTGYHGFGNVSLEDIERRNSIAFLLLKWNMISIPDINIIKPYNTHIDIISYKDAHMYQKIKKFNVDNLNN